MSGDLNSAIAISADEAPERKKRSNYPEPFASMMAGRVKRPLGVIFGLQNFGVNHVTMPAGSMSSLHHRHSAQDEFVIVLSGEITLETDDGEFVLQAGMCAGFPHGGTAHHLINRSGDIATYLEVGDRSPGDTVTYPNDDLKAVHTSSGWHFARKDGRPY